MPGKRYNFKITAGPWKGLRARILGNAATQGNYLVDVQGVKLNQGEIASIPWTQLERLQNKTPRHPGPRVTKRTR